MDRTNSESELKIKIVPTYTQLRYVFFINSNQLIRKSQNMCEIW